MLHGPRKRQTDCERKSPALNLISNLPARQRQLTKFRSSLMLLLTTCTICFAVFSHLAKWLHDFRRRTNDREKQSLMTERERQNNAQRTYENDLHAMQMKESNLKIQIRDKDTLEASIETMKNDISTFTTRLKVTDIYGYQQMA